MAGFENSVMVSKNINFDELGAKPRSGIINAAGKIPIGTGNSSPTPEILGGSLTSPLGTITIGYVSPNITLDVAGGIATTSFNVQANTAPGTDPVIPTAGGLVTVNGAAVSNHSVVLETRSRAANAYNLEVQYGTSAAATDATKSGVAHFNSAQFTVDANGFVSTSGTGIANTITGDTGGALSPTAGNWNILGLSGSKTSGTGSTLTIKSPPFSQVGSSSTSSLNTGEFVTSAVTRTLPASAGLADGDLFIYVCTTSGALVIQAVGAQKIRIGSLISSTAGSATSTQIGDSIQLRFNATDGFFYSCGGPQGTWVLA